MEQKAMVKRTDVILSIGILVLVLLALALMVATGSTGEFVAWAWERHHNVLSWYIRGCADRRVANVSMGDEEPT